MTNHISHESEKYTKSFDELTEILARGYLRLLLSEGEKKRSNCLNRLDISTIASNELDVKLTAAEKRREA